MKQKVLLCALTALVLLSFTRPAAALLSNERGTVIEAMTRMPIINVTVPGSAEVFINPFQLPLEIDGESRREQIVCTPAMIASASDVPLKVGVTVRGAVKEGSDMTLAASPTGGNGTTKSAFVYFEIVQSNSDYISKSLWADAYDPAKHILVSTGGPQSKQDMLTLPPMTKDGDIAKGGYAPFRLAGDAVRNPASEWDKNDGINVMITFSFTPVSYVT